MSSLSGETCFFSEQEEQRCETHVGHGDLLRSRPRVVGAIGQHAIGLLHTLILVLVQVTVHLLPLFPGGEGMKEHKWCGKSAKLETVMTVV